MGLNIWALWSVRYEIMDPLGEKKNVRACEAECQIPGHTRMALAAFATREVVGSYIDYKTKIKITTRNVV